MERPEAKAAAPPLPPASLGARLFAEPYRFDFFQAVRLLEELAPDRAPVGRTAAPAAEVVRFRAHLSISFPPSQIARLVPPAEAGAPPEMTVPFFGLTGPSGILPRNYTDLLLRLQRDTRGPERTALRDWFDLFNHRLLSLFYRAWEKYRFALAYERGEWERGEPDAFTLALLSFIGMGQPSLRRRLCVSHWEAGAGRVLAQIDDRVLLHYSGLLVQRPRSAAALAALLQDYFEMPVEVRQFHGQWLQLDRGNQSSLSDGDSNNLLGASLVAGDRVWDVVGKIRVRLGPLGYAQFAAFIPDASPSPEHKAFHLLAHLVRLFVGPELTFDVQLVLRAEDVPECCLSDDEDSGPRLGWNTWVLSREPGEDAADPVFEGEEVFWVNAEERVAAARA
jgi:type VI secretion system protein ImpH